MTKILFDLKETSPQGDVPIDAQINCYPVARRKDGTVLVTRRGFTERTGFKPTIVELHETALDSAWLITINSHNNDVVHGFYTVPVPHMVEGVEEPTPFNDLVLVDPDSLEPDADPDPLWWAMARSTVVSGEVNAAGDLILHHYDGKKTNAGRVKGDKGDRGERGLQGEQGLQGVQGAKGDTGATGVQGAQGERGEQGIAGVDGVDGAKGETGETGAQGIQGIKGDQGTKGDKGDKGVKGDKGDAGADGTSVTIKGTVSTAAELPLTGNTIGDGWITSNDGHMHVWGGAAFTDVGLVRGPQGMKGNTGDTGLQGVKGDQGIQGVKGDQGLQGVKGAKGDKGDKGAKGDGIIDEYRSANGQAPYRQASDAPNTYPKGFITGLYASAEGWPHSPFSNVTTFSGAYGASKAQIATPYNGATGEPMIRYGLNSTTWTPFKPLRGDLATITANGLMSSADKSKLDSVGEEITPEKYGAIGDGATDDTSAIQQAINEAASTGKPVMFGGRNYKATGSLLKLWDVVLEGTGSIVKSETSFPIAPLRNDTITLYADGGRTASGDGLSWASAIQTLGGIETRIRSLSALHLDRRIVVKLRGTFSDGYTFSSLPITPYPIRFEGEETEGDPITKVVKGTSSFGMRFEPGGNVVIRKILFDGFAVGFNGYGALMKGLGRFKVEYCVAQNCDIGFAAINNVNFTITDTIARNCNSNGFRIQYSSSGLWSRCSAINNGNSGFFASRNAVAHLDYCTADGNGQNGLTVDMSARVACIANSFKNNGGYGVRTEGSGEWLRDDTTGGPNNFFLDTEDANIVGPHAQFGVSRETRLYSQTATNEFKVFGNYETTTVTGNTSNNVILVTPSGYGLPVDFFRSPGQKVRVKMWGRFVGGAGTKTIRLSTTGLTGNNINHVHTRVFAGGEGNASWCMETDLYANYPTLTVIQGLGTSSRGGETPRMININTVSELVNGVRFRVYGQLSDVSDSIELHGFELYVSG